MLKYRISYLFILLASGLFYLFYDNSFSFLFLLFILILPGLSFVLTLITIPFITLKLDFPYVVHKEELADFSIIMQNRGIFPLSCVKIPLELKSSFLSQKKEAVIFLPICVHCTKTIKKAILSNYSGKLTLDVTKIKIYDYFGIFAFSKNVNLSGTVFVLPNAVSIDAKIEPHSESDLETNTYSKTKSGNDPSEIFEIREYREGDSLKKIHWKLSSKLQQLFVKEYSLPIDCSTLFIIDLQKAPIEFIDTQIEAICSLSMFLTENNLSHDMEWYHPKNSCLQKQTVQTTDDLSTVLNSILSIEPYDDMLAIKNYIAESNSSRYSHIFYFTSQLSAPLFSALEKESHKVTIFLTAKLPYLEEQASIIDSLSRLKITIIPIEPQKVRESLEGVNL